MIFNQHIYMCQNGYTQRAKEIQQSKDRRSPDDAVAQRSNVSNQLRGEMWTVQLPSLLPSRQLLAVW
jgi:hypothetical protein